MGDPMTYKATSITEVYRSESLSFAYEIQDGGVAQDVSDWTVTAHLFLGTNNQVASGATVTNTTDGTNGQIDVSVDTDQAPGTYEFQVWGIDASGNKSMLVVERVKILFNSHDRD